MREDGQRCVASLDRAGWRSGRPDLRNHIRPARRGFLQLSRDPLPPQKIAQKPGRGRFTSDGFTESIATSSRSSCRIKSLSIID